MLCVFEAMAYADTNSTEQNLSGQPMPYILSQGTYAADCRCGLQQPLRLVRNPRPRKKGLESQHMLRHSLAFSNILTSCHIYYSQMTMAQKMDDLNAAVVSYIVKGRYAIITLNNPKTLNALTSMQYYRLASIMDKIDANPAVLITVLTGNGRYFSA